MYPILFQFGPITIYSFGAFMALAALAGAWVVQLELKRTGYDPELTSPIVFTAVLAGLVGARLLFIFEEWSNFLRSPWDYIFTGAGFTWYGGFFGGALGASWVVCKNKIPWHRAADIIAPAVAIAYGIGRIGCHVAGDGDWGRVTDAPWGVAYTRAIIGWVDPSTGIPYPPGVRVHPTPIYEFIESFIIFAILWSLRKKDYPAGTMFWLCLILTGLARFVVEFWRINPAIGFGLTEAQWFGLAFTAVGLIQLTRSGARSPKRAS
jgi:phosphatidylglycerol:prolipoprotein diacylglycerol transferase